MNTNLALAEEHVIASPRYFYTGVVAIDYTREPDFLLTLRTRREEVDALIEKKHRRAKKLISSAYGATYDNLRKTHSHDTAMKITERELNKAIAKQDKLYEKRLRKVYAKYQSAIDAS